MRSLRVVLASALLAVAALNLLAACTPEDDSDQLPPTETPTPQGARNCQVVWTSQNEDDSALIDVFVLDAPEDTWTGGLSTFLEFTASYQPGLENPAGAVTMALDERGAVVASSETFSLSMSANETKIGADVDVNDSTPNRLLGIDTAGEITTTVVGTNTALTFDGVWSDPEAELLDLGVGEAELVLGTAGSITLGDYGTWAICYESLEASSAPRRTVQVRGLSRLPR